MLFEGVVRGKKEKNTDDNSENTVLTQSGEEEQRRAVQIDSRGYRSQKPRRRGFRELALASAIKSPEERAQEKTKEVVSNTFPWPPQSNIYVRVLEPSRSLAVMVAQTLEVRSDAQLKRMQ
jgi:hypothetical protein